ncbi:MAG: alpha/beta hydrolase [Rhodospirillales bacterium]|nr:alpha/beta hydrolase [Rhodospirillales bacterium]
MLDPELKPFLEIWSQSWKVLPENASPVDRRLLFEHIADQMRLPAPQDVSSEVRFVATEKRNVLVRIDRHRSAGAQPCLIYMHGGGWAQGSPATHADITMRIAASNRQTVVSIDYALAPEHPFPQAVHECRDTVTWVHENADALGVDAQRIAVGGDSAGANLAAAIAIDLIGSPYRLIAQLLIYPPVDFAMDRPSYSENADGPLLKVAGMSAGHAAYCPNAEDRVNPLAAPLMAASHKGLPPAFIAVAENDPLRDDGHAYADKLRAAGVAVELDAGHGLIHGYLRAMAYCEASRESFRRMCQWLAGRNQAGSGPLT